MPVTDRAVLVLKIDRASERMLRRVVLFHAVGQAQVLRERFVPEPPHRDGEEDGRNQPRRTAEQG